MRRQEWEEISHQVQLFSYFNSKVLRVGTQKEKNERGIKPQKSRKYSLPVAYVSVQRMDVGLGNENCEACKNRNPKHLSS